MALVLLGGAGALLKTLFTMRSTLPGFQTDNLLVVDFWLPQPKYSILRQRLSFFDVVLERVRSMPGVRSAALVADLPLGGGSDSLSFHVVGKPNPAPGQMFDARFNLASTDYFKTMGIPVREGRELSEDDRANATGVAVINETAARLFWPGEKAIGQQIVLPTERAAQVEEHATERDGGAGQTSVTLTVVGIVGDVHQQSVGIPSRPEFFLNTQQADLPWPWLVLVVKTVQSDPLTLSSSIK